MLGVCSVFIKEGGKLYPITLIDFVFYNERKIRISIEIMRKTYLKPYKTMRFINDPTSTLAIEHLTPIKFVKIGEYRLKSPEQWLKVIDSTYKADEVRGLIALMKYSGFDQETIQNRFKITAEEYHKTIYKFRIDALNFANIYKLIKNLKKGIANKNKMC